MKENEFFARFNGNFYRYNTKRGEVGFVRDINSVVSIPSLTNVTFMPKLKLISNFVDFVSMFGATTNITTDGHEITGAIAFISDHDGDKVNIVCRLENGIIRSWVEHEIGEGKVYLDLSDLEDCNFVLSSVFGCVCA